MNITKIIKMDIHQIVDVVAEEAEVNANLLASESEDERYHIPRQVVCYIAKAYFGMSWVDIAPAFPGVAIKTLGGRYRRAREMREDQDYSNLLDRCAAILKGREVPPKKATNRARRKCRMCMEDFDSEHIGNRLCEPCKENPVFRSGMAA